MIFGDFDIVPWMTDRCLYKMTKTFKRGEGEYMDLGVLMDDQVVKLQL